MTDTITTDLDPSPSRTRPTVFSAEMDTFLGKLPAWTTEANALAVDANANAVAAASSASDSANSAIASANSAASSGIYATQAASYANFKGLWSSLTGALAVPASVYHVNKYWMLLSNIADVTAKTPGVATEWVEYGVFDAFPNIFMMGF
jgi:hypothetical protein